MPTRHRQHISPSVFCLLAVDLKRLPPLSWPTPLSAGRRWG